MVKKTVTISVDEDIDKFFEGIRTKIINIDGQEIKRDRKKSEIYSQALEYALEHADEWVL